MTATTTTTPPKRLSYKDYLDEGEVKARYAIIDGVRIFMPSPTRRHQRIQGHTLRALGEFERTTGVGQVLGAPCDVLIFPEPLSTRQPDVLFISHERLAQNGEESVADALSPAPELVVEILSPSDRPTVLYAKLADFAAVDVRECWVIDPMAETVEVLTLTHRSVFVSAMIYTRGQQVISLVFPALTVSVDDLFAP